MGKIGYVLFIVIVLIGILMLIPNSPIYPLAAHYALKKMESRWNCKVIEKRISANPLSGTVSLKNLSIKTPEAVNPTWRLQIKSATLKISYLSLIQNKTIDMLALDGVVFKQEYKEIAGIPPKKEPSQREKPQKSESDPSHPDRAGAPEGVRIKRLVIRNGSFEYIRIDASGVKKSITANQISVVRKDILLDKRPDEFFIALFRQA